MLGKKNMAVESLKLHLGCGISIASGWMNVDSSPNALAAKLPFYILLKQVLFKLGLISENAYKANWDKNILLCDLGKSFPDIPINSCSEIYSSHFIEHIPHKKASKLVNKCFTVLKPGGIFRVAVPDLYAEAKLYIEKFV